MRIAVAQLNTVAGDFASTADRMVDFSQNAADLGVDLLVFPLATLTGVQPVSYANLEGYVLDLMDTLERLVRDLACPCVVPAATSFGGDSVPGALLIDNGSIKPLGLSPRGPREAGELSTFELGGMLMGLAYTYDDINAFEDEQSDLDVLLFLSAHTYALDDASSAMGSAIAENRYVTDARMLDAWVVGASSLGGYGMHVFPGSSFVLTPGGELIASAPAFEEALMVAEVDAEDDNVPNNALEPEIYNRSLFLWEALVLGMRDYLGKLGRSDVGLVLDGSLASCAVAVLASDALGPTHVRALLSPARGERATRVARDLLRALRLEAIECDVYAAEQLDQPDQSYVADICEAQLARLARQESLLPLSVLDKTALALEIADAACRAGQLLPLGDVYRSDVIELAHLRNTISPIIPAEAFREVDVPDIEGLDEVGPSVEAQLRQVDVTLATHVEWERSVSDIAAQHGNPELAERIVGRMRELDAARALCPPCIMASSHLLIESNLPLCLAWRDHVREESERLGASHVGERLNKLFGITAKEDSAPTVTQPQASNLASFLEELGADFMAGALPDGVSREEVESSIGDLLGLLSDMSQSGSLGTDGDNPPLDGPFGPLTWGSPFSEN